MNIVECFTCHFRLGFFCILTLIAFSSVAETEADLDSAISAVKSEEYEKAFKQFQLLADKGIAEAQHNLAMMYRLGKGTKKNYELSNKWFREAAEKGVSDAQYYLGHAYDTGEGIAADRKYAFVWYHKAAEKGHGLAQINLGVLYANGLGTKQDVEQAYLWFHVAAAQGYRLAFENKEIIEKTLESDVIEKLKQEGRIYYQKYVMPFQRHSSSYPRLR
jgi:TPR repeat protein